MATQMPRFQLGATCKVVGVGSAGCKIVSGLDVAGMQAIELLTTDTDMAALTAWEAPVKIALGGLQPRVKTIGCGPIVGRHAAEESYEELGAALKGADMIFIVAGMGGCTGSGAAPVIAQVARELGALTVGVITEPFNFEGSRRRRIAAEGASALREGVDTMIRVANDRLLHLADKKMTMSAAFGFADDVLRTVIRSIAGTFAAPGLQTLGFGELRRLLADGGNATIGIGRASGERRAAVAAAQALSSPLLYELPAARSVLFTFAGGQYTSFEVAQAATAVMEKAVSGNSTCLGAVLDESLDEEVRVLVLAVDVPDEPGPSDRVRPAMRPPTDPPPGWTPPAGPPFGGLPPSDQRIPRVPPRRPLAGSAAAVPAGPDPREADADQSIVGPWLVPDRPRQGGVSPAGG